MDIGGSRWQVRGWKVANRNSSNEQNDRQKGNDYPVDVQQNSLFLSLKSGLKNMLQGRQVTTPKEGWNRSWVLSVRLPSQLIQTGKG
jgi:hypothetical protein